MRILHLTPRYYPVQGGAERYWREISNRLASRGHQVTILTSDADHFEYFWDARQHHLSERTSQDGSVTILRLPLRHWPGGEWPYRARRRLLWLANQGNAPVGLLNRLARQTPRLPAMWDYLDTLKQPFDIIAAVNVAYEQFGMAGLNFAQRRQLPFVYYPLTHLGAGEQPAADKLSSFYTQRHQIALAQNSDALVTITPSEARFYVDKGVSQSHIRVAEPGYVSSGPVGNGNRWRTQHGVEQPILLFLGTMSFDKGTVTLLEAAQQLWSQGQQFKLVLAGQPTAAFQAILGDLSATDQENIILRHNVSEAEKVDLLAAATILALPSRVESFGIVFQEAWAQGKPVIAGRTWGISEDVVHHEQDGLLVKFGHVTELVAAVARLLNDPLLAAQLGERGQANLNQRYNWSDKIDTIEALYQGLL